MPTLLRKLVVFAAVDGLILQPYGYGQRGNNSNANTPLPPPVLIEYQTHRISDLPASSRGSVGCESLEAHGIVGKRRF
jgi:hypothetical protein